MSMIATLLAEEGAHALPMPAMSYGLIALVTFALLLGVTWAFRNTHQKSVPPGEHGHGHEHGAHDGQDAAHGSAQHQH